MNAAVIATDKAAVTPAGMIFFVRLYLEIITTDSSPEKNMATIMFMRAAAPTILRALRAKTRAEPPAETRDLPLPFLTYAKMPPAVKHRGESKAQKEGSGKVEALYSAAVGAVLTVPLQAANTKGDCERGILLLLRRGGGGLGALPCVVLKAMTRLGNVACMA